MNNTAAKSTGRISRHKRVRAKVEGTAARPRLSIYKSNRYFEAQLIDDEKGVTLASAKMDDAQKLGEAIAKKAQEKGVSNVVFDRGGFRYTGSIAVLADAARKAGLKF